MDAGCFVASRFFLGAGSDAASIGIFIPFHIKRKSITNPFIISFKKLFPGSIHKIDKRKQKR